MNLGKYIRIVNRRHKQMMRLDTTYLMEGLLHPGNTLTPPWTLPSLTTCTPRPPNGPTRAPPSPPCKSRKWWLTTLIQWPQPSISPPGTLVHPLPATRTRPGDEISCQLTRGKPSPKGHPSQPDQPGKSPGGLTIRRPQVVRTLDRGRGLMVVGREEERERRWISVKPRRRFVR